MKITRSSKEVDGIVEARINSVVFWLLFEDELLASSLAPKQACSLHPSHCLC